MARSRKGAATLLTDGLQAGVVARPSGMPAFTKLPQPKIVRLGGGRFRAVVDYTSLIPTGGTTYYVSRSGSGGNTGLTAGSPWPINTAITAVNAGAGGDTIVMLSSTDEYQGTNWSTITKSCRIVADAPGVRATNWSSPGFTWTAVSGSAGADDTVYSTPKGTINGVFDLLNTYTWTDYTGRNHRNYTEYVNKGTGADQAAALALITGDGQYAFDGTNLYVRPTGLMDMTDTTARKNLRVRTGAGTGIIADGTGVVVYLRGIAWEGHSYMRAQNNAIVIAEDCSFKYKSGDGTTHDGGHVIHIRCTASGNSQDGFNYHDAAGNSSEFIEIDCVSAYNGMQKTDDINNASTCHEGVRGIRVGGAYSHTEGPTIADVNTAKTWNLGVDARDSVAVSAANRVNYLVNSTAVMWLDECSSDGLNVNGGSGSGYNFAANGSQIHLNGFRGAAHPKSVDTSGGTVDYYTPGT